MSRPTEDEVVIDPDGKFGGTRTAKGEAYATEYVQRVADRTNAENPVDASDAVAGNSMGWEIATESGSVLVIADRDANEIGMRLLVDHQPPIRLTPAGLASLRRVLDRADRYLTRSVPAKGGGVLPTDDDGA